MNNRRRQILRAMQMMYDQQGFRPRTTSEICTALDDFAEAFAAGLMTLADSIKNIRIPTVQNVTVTWAYDETTKEESHMKHCPCEVCNNAFKGFTDCKLNLEAECREGGGYEAFEPIPVPEEPKLSVFEKVFRIAIISISFLCYPLAVYRLCQLVRDLIERFGG